MIMPWNRSEVYCGFSVRDCNNILKALDAKGIKYIRRTVGHSTKYRIMDMNNDYSRMVYIYIHKKDVGKFHIKRD